MWRTPGWPSTSPRSPNTARSATRWASHSAHSGVRKPRSRTFPAIARARQTFTIGTADLDVAEVLGVPLGSPVAEVRRVFASADGTVIYLGEVTYRGDFISIDMDLRP